MARWLQARRGAELVPTWVNLDALTDIAVLPDPRPAAEGGEGGYLIEGYLPARYENQPNTVLLATGIATLEEATARVNAAVGGAAR